MRIWQILRIHVSTDSLDFKDDQPYRLIKNFRDLASPKAPISNSVLFLSALL